ncbi:hypothetical protein AGR2A_pb10126 [Agrobacterium genomosp. 2 str. CFBP 5494]|uniref:Uncharacterized protein n=1 Tax=Agrobacterium genomosp. 2 str. CFBP 5494 TaxID=1183436 RepID=A0A9W5B7N3_9HYPH|nr:hypothetical protein AGR2A_pb10126 [Agrobacterium genomosp. 2 str. CFBP 5494]
MQWGMPTGPNLIERLIDMLKKSFWLPRS